jgi:hypothetical protein
VPQRTLAELGSLLLAVEGRALRSVTLEVERIRRKRDEQLLDGTLVDTTALVDEVTSGGRLSRVDVSDDNNVNVSW